MENINEELMELKISIGVIKFSRNVNILSSGLVTLIGIYGTLQAEFNIKASTVTFFTALIYAIASDYYNDQKQKYEQVYYDKLNSNKIIN